MKYVFIEFYYQVDGKQFRFQCEPNCPTAIAKEASMMFFRELEQMENSSVPEPVNQEIAPETPVEE